MENDNNNFEDLRNSITDENEHIFDLMDFIKKKVQDYLEKLPGITPAIRFETLKNIMGQAFLRIKSNKSAYIKLRPQKGTNNFVNTLQLDNLDPLLNSLLVKYDIYKIKSVDKIDKLLILSRHDPQFYADVEKVNQRISELFILEKQPIKKLIVAEVNNLYEKLNKDFLLHKSSIIKKKNLGKQTFLKNIYPFLEHYQADWDLDSFLFYANNN